MSTINANGLTIDRYLDIKEGLEDDIKSSFGENTKLTARSIFGQLIKIFSLSIAEQNELIELIAGEMNPQAASGVWLSYLVLLNGIQRQEGTYSTVSLYCTANNAGTTIPAGSLVSDDTGNQFATDEELTLAANASGYVTATCTVKGAVTADAGTLENIDTPIYGWSEVTNQTAVTAGEEEETDTELRARRALVAERAGSGSVSGIYGAISDLDGVGSVKVVENNGSSVDSYGVPPQNIWCIVDGGDEDEIAGAIYSKKGGGIGMVGSTTVDYYDSVTGDTHEIKYSEATEVDIYIDVELTITNQTEYDAAGGDTAVENALVEYFDTYQKLNDDVVYSRLYTPINNIPGHQVDSLEIGETSSPSSTSNITIAVNEKAVTSTAKITVTS